MTISSTNRVATFVGNGSTANFPFTFKIFEQTDLSVTTLNVATGAVAALALTTNYSVSINADQDTSPGGTITLTAGNLPTGYELTITTDIPALQGLDLANAGAFYPDVINTALDLLTVLIQQLQSQVSVLVSQLPQTGGGSGGVTPVTQIASGVVNAVNPIFTFVASIASTPVPLVFAGGIFQTEGIDYGTPTLVGGVWQILFAVPPGVGPIAVVLF